MAGTPQVNTQVITDPGFFPLTIPVYAASAIAAADELTSLVIGGPYELLKVDFVTVTPITTAGKTATITPKIDGVAVPGTTTPLAGTQAKGAVVNVFKASGVKVFGSAVSTLSLTASAVTPFLEGAGYFVATLRDLGGVTP